MREIEAENIYPGLNQLKEHIISITSRPNCCYNFSAVNGMLIGSLLIHLFVEIFGNILTHNFVLLVLILSISACASMLRIKSVPDWGALTGQDFYNFNPFITYLLFGFNSIVQRRIMHFVIHDAYHDVLLSLDQSFYGRITHSAGN